MANIVIIDYNLGNLQSIQAAFLRLGQETVISRDLEEIRRADALILPGVGAFPTAMNNLKKFNLIDVLKERADAGIPILGICLGMQVLFEKGIDIEECQGLGLLKGEVIPIKSSEKIPHIVGKNNVIGCQFHPEKSGKIGGKILRAFLEEI